MPRKLLRYVYVLNFLLLGLLPLSAVQLYYEMPEAEVYEVLGRPTSTAELGKKKILMYEGGVRIELKGGLVQRAKGIDFTFVQPINPPPPLPEPLAVDDVEPVTENVVIEAEPALVEPPASEPQQLDPSYEDVMAATQEAVKEFGEYDGIDYSEYTEEDYAYEEIEWPWWASVLIGAIGFGVDFGLTYFILMLAFRHVGFSVFWKELLLLSFLTALLASIIIAVTDAIQLDFFFLQQALILSSLIGLIILLTDVKTFTTAAKIALAARAITLLIGFLIIAGSLMLIDAIL